MKNDKTPEHPKKGIRQFEFVDLYDLLQQPIGDELPELLREAAACIEGKNLQSAVWRIADAVQMLSARLKAKGYKNLEGVDRPTGRGAQLSLKHLK
jgi:hypothetical protein